MTYVEIREQLNASNRDKYKRIGRFSWDCVPSVGELINLNGHPYIVIRRGWAASTDSNGPWRKYGEELMTMELWCYLDVLPATPHGE